MRKNLAVGILIIVLCAACPIWVKFPLQIPEVRASAGDVFIQTSDVTVTNTTTETSIIGTGAGSTTVGAQFFAQGSVSRYLILGRISTAVATPGTFRIRVKIGSVVVADTGDQSMTANITDGGFLAVAWSTCRTTGASGILMTQGTANMPSGLLSAAQWGMVNTTTQTIDTLTSQTFDITV